MYLGKSDTEFEVTKLKHEKVYIAIHKKVYIAIQMNMWILGFQSTVSMVSMCQKNPPNVIAILHTAQHSWDG